MLGGEGLSPHSRGLDELDSAPQTSAFLKAFWKASKPLPTVLFLVDFFEAFRGVRQLGSFLKTPSKAQQASNREHPEKVFCLCSRNLGKKYHNCVICLP